MEEQLRARLLVDGGVSGLVGTRITWIDRPQASGLPAVTLEPVSPGREYTYAGASDTSNPLIQITSWGRTAKEAAAVKRAIVAALEPRATQDGLRFGPSFVRGDVNIGPDELPGGIKVYGRALTMEIWHSPA